MKTIVDAAGPEAPNNPVLFENDIHIWYSSLDVLPSSFEWLESTLDSRERVRSNSYCSELERKRFVIGRGILREILARYSGVPPEDLHFDYCSRGKPSLVEAGGKIQFNLAHSGGRAVYAVVRYRRIGVDIEQVVPTDGIEQIADRFFSNGEKNRLHSLSQDERLEAFFKIWTCKEAYLKACGKGLAHPLDEIEISLECVGAPGGLKVKGADSCWSLELLQPGFGFVAAVCVEGKYSRLDCWEWPGLRVHLG